MACLTPQTIPVSAVNNTQRAWILHMRKCHWIHHHSQGKKRLPTVSSIYSIWYYIVLTHNVGFLSLMVKPFLSKTGSATVNVQQWVDLQSLSTITWLLQHTNIILWAPDQISHPSHSLWAELQSQNPLLSFSFLFSPFHILRVPLENSHQSSPVPSLLPCSSARLHRNRFL